MALIQNILNSALNDNVKLPDLLRKCKILATRLKNDDFKNWIDSELNGYPSQNNLPSYRIIDVNAYGHLSGPFGAEMRNITIPSSCLPEKMRDWARKTYISQSISVLEDMVKGNQDNFKQVWPGDLVAMVANKIYKGYSLYAAWQDIPRGAFVSILDTVRTRILSFILEIEKEISDIDETPPGSQPLPQERVNQVFNNYIMGNVGNIASGGNEIKQSNILNIQQGNFDSLRLFLSDYGVNDQALNELKESLKDDYKNNEQKQIGKKTSMWIRKMINKASSGAWKIGASIASTILTRAISSYLGLPI